MVATSMHYLAGVVIAYLFGIKDYRKYYYGLLAIIPDLDSIILILISLFSGGDFGFAIIERSQTLVVLLAHRAISHSLLVLIVVAGGLALWKKRLGIIAGAMIASHLFLDFITAWKFFPFLPFSYNAYYLGVIEVFDSFLVWFIMLIFAGFVAMDLANNQKKRHLIFSYIFIIVFGLLPSFAFGEFNIQTIIVSQATFFAIAGVAFLYPKEKVIFVGKKVVTSVVIVTVVYLGLLTINQAVYSNITGVPITGIEPVEEFAINNNAHTFEQDLGNEYRIGIIDLAGIQEEKTVPKLNDTTGTITPELFAQYQTAYDKAILVNWINHPVWNFQEGEDGQVYANLRYAKIYLDHQIPTGPRNGINVILEDGLLVGYGELFGG